MLCGWIFRRDVVVNIDVLRCESGGGVDFRTVEICGVFPQNALIH